jgi:hypothetical protein
MTKHAYLNADSIVVQVIHGAVDGAAHDALLRDYGVLFGAVRCVRVVDSSAPIWIGGTYDAVNGFTPPPQPEPLPEPLPEPELQEPV